MAVSKRLRYEILRRDNFACHYCGAAAPDVKLNADHRAAALNRDAEKRRQTLPIHLHMVWSWAWRQTGRVPTELDEYYFAEETAKTLAAGYAACVDLTGAAYKAGLDNAVDIQSYVMLPQNPSTEDRRFVAGVDAINAWETAWERASPDGPAVGNLVSAVIDHVTVALDAGHERDYIVDAAMLAGSSLSTDLAHFLPKRTQAGGGI